MKKLESPEWHENASKIHCPLPRIVWNYVCRALKKCCIVTGLKSPPQTCCGLFSSFPYNILQFWNEMCFQIYTWECLTWMNKGKEESMTQKHWHKKGNAEFKMKLLTHNFPATQFSCIMFIKSPGQNFPCIYKFCSACSQ